MFISGVTFFCTSCQPLFTRMSVYQGMWHTHCFTPPLLNSLLYKTWLEVAVDPPPSPFWNQQEIKYFPLPIPRKSLQIKNFNNFQTKSSSKTMSIKNNSLFLPPTPTHKVMVFAVTIIICLDKLYLAWWLVWYALLIWSNKNLNH